jgi:hypothetical protein
MAVILVKTDLHPDEQKRLIRMRHDVRWLMTWTAPEVRAVYDEIEAMRDLLSRILDKVDGKR